MASISVDVDVDLDDFDDDEIVQYLINRIVKKKLSPEYCMDLLQSLMGDLPDDKSPENIIEWFKDPFISDYDKSQVKKAIQ